MARDPRLARTPPLSSSELTKAAGDKAPPWLRKLVFAMDDLVPIPGMDRGIGLDAIIGFFLPGVGDALSALTTLALIGVAVKQKVPGVVIARMVLQQLVDMIVGTIPVAGDVFDALNRANRQNLELLERHAQTRLVPTLADRLWVVLAVLVGLGLVVLPFVVVYGLYEAIARLVAG